jgi:hypothetical protein
MVLAAVEERAAASATTSQMNSPGAAIAAVPDVLCLGRGDAVLGTDAVHATFGDLAVEAAGSRFVFTYVRRDFIVATTCMAHASGLPEVP